MSTQRAGIEGRREGRAVNVAEVHSDGRRTDGGTRTDTGITRADAAERAQTSEGETERIGNGGVRFPKPQPTPFPVRAGERERGTQNNSVATKAKKTGTTDRHRRPVDRSKRVKKPTRRFLGGKQRERGDDVSQPPVGPLLSRLSMVTFCRRRLRPFLCKSLCYATINKEGGRRQAGRMARPSQRRSCRSWDG